MKIKKLSDAISYAFYSDYSLIVKYLKKIIYSYDEKVFAWYKTATYVCLCFHKIYFILKIFGKIDVKY